MRMGDQREGISALNCVGDWASLHDHLLDSILDHLLPIAEDCIRFSAVCNHWRSLACEKFQRQQRLLPLLLLPNDDDAEERQSLYSVNNSRMIGELKLRLPQHLKFGGCCCGWLIYSNFAEVRLVNPFSGRTIGIPPIPDRELCDIHKGVLSRPPDSTYPNAYVLMVIHGGAERRIAFFKSGDEAWTCTDEKLKGCVDITYSQGLFFGLFQRGDSDLLLSFEVGKDLEMKEFRTPRDTCRPPPCCPWHALRRIGRDLTVTYLTKSREKGKEHLLKVRRIFNPQRLTTEFQIFKLEGDGGGNKKWTKVTSLGEDVSLFLGHDQHSVSFLASTYNRDGACRPNLIYFYELYFHVISCINLVAAAAANLVAWSDDPSYRIPFRIGVFNLEDGSIDYSYIDYVPVMPHPPIWVAPSFPFL